MFSKELVALMRMEEDVDLAIESGDIGTWERVIDRHLWNLATSEEIHPAWRVVA